MPFNSSVFDLDESSPFKLDCRVEASPAPVLVQWLHYPNASKLPNNKTFMNDDQYTVVSNNSLLSIESVRQTEASGYYVCIAINQMNDSFGLNRVGKDLSDIVELNVRFMPKTTVFNKKIAVNVTQITEAKSYKQKLTCMSVANPRPEFNWYKDGERLLETELYSKYTIVSTPLKGKYAYESTLTINDLNVSNLNRNYECDAVNLLGTSRVKMELVPLSKPDKPTEFNLVYSDFMSISLSWLPGFDGGLPQSFKLKLNDSILNVDNSTCNESEYAVCIRKDGLNLLSIMNLKYNTIYSIQLIGFNQLGMSEPSDSILVKTNDLTKADDYLLPVFESLYLNVPKERLEFKLKSKFTSRPRPNSIPFSFNLIVETMERPQVLYKLKTSLNLPRKQEQFSFVELADKELQLESMKQTFMNAKPELVVFQSRQVKSMKISICFMTNQNLCSATPTPVVIDIFDKFSHSSPMSNSPQLTNSNDESVRGVQISKNNSQTIPIALIIGICVCILLLIMFLFLTIIYCIRRRNFKICKNILTSNLNVSEKDSDKVKLGESEKKSSSHTNKTFNIDIGSISAPMQSITGSHLTESSSSDMNNSAGYGTGSGLNVINGSMTSSCHESNATTVSSSINKRITYTANLSVTTTNMIGRKPSEILVIEDDEQQLKSCSLLNKQSMRLNKLDEEIGKTRQVSLSKSSSSTGVSNCSSLGNNSTNQIIQQQAGQFIYTEFVNSFDHTDQKQDMFSKTNAYIDTYNCSSSGSNSDPIAINNSLSSNNSSGDNSPIYGYNVTAATTAANQFNQHKQIDTEIEHMDNLLYIKTGLTNLKHDGVNLRHHKTHSTNNLVQTTNSTSASSKHNSFHASHNVYSDAPESGYSTPSRLKKVVYEVIV